MKSIKKNLYFLIFIISIMVFLLLQNVCAQGEDGDTYVRSSLNQLVSSIYQKPDDLIQKKLLKDEYSLIHGKCATPIISRVLAHPDWLDEENRL